MKLRYTMAAVALFGVAAFSAPALAIEQIHIPDADAAPSSAPPDALFDKSIPTTWQKKANDQQSGQSGFHFSMSGSSNNGPYSSGYGSSNGFGEDAKVPGSEFRQNGVPLQDPYLLPR